MACVVLSLFETSIESIDKQTSSKWFKMRNMSKAPRDMVLTSEHTEVKNVGRWTFCYHHRSPTNRPRTHPHNQGSRLTLRVQLQIGRPHKGHRAFECYYCINKKLDWVGIFALFRALVLYFICSYRYRILAVTKGIWTENPSRFLGLQKRGGLLISKHPTNPRASELRRNSTQLDNYSEIKAVT